MLFVFLKPRNLTTSSSKQASSDDQNEIVFILFFTFSCATQQCHDMLVVVAVLWGESLMIAVMALSCKNAFYSNNSSLLSNMRRRT